MKTEKMLALRGRIDSNNAEEVFDDIIRQLGDERDVHVILDASDLEYISSAGLRMILRLRRSFSDISVIGVTPHVYEVFDTTGFTEMMNIEKAYRTISVDGCEEIGWGANSKIYRLDSDRVVKVYTANNALEEIKHEREVARRALILGIPTAISFEIVKVGDHYGSVFELLNAKSFSYIIATQPERMDWCVNEYITLLKKIHSITVPEGKLPDMKDIVIGWLEYIRELLPDDAYDKALRLINEIPHDDHVIHGDYHTKNIMVQGDEVLLIDMDTLAVGHPIFELSMMFMAYIGFSEADHEHIMRFQGYDFETAARFWRKSLAAYLGTDDEKRLNEVEEKSRVLSYIRMMRIVLKATRKGVKKEVNRIDHWQTGLIECLKNTDTLLY